MAEFFHPIYVVVFLMDSVYAGVRLAQGQYGPAAFYAFCALCAGLYADFLKRHSLKKKEAPGASKTTPPKDTP